MAGVAGCGLGRGSGRTTGAIAGSVTGARTSAIAAGCGPASIGAWVFSMRGEPRPRGPTANQPARTAAPHSAAHPASHRGLITISPLVWSKPAPAPRCTLCTRRTSQERIIQTGLYYIEMGGKDSDKTAATQERKLQLIMFSEICCSDTTES